MRRDAATLLCLFALACPAGPGCGGPHATVGPTADAGQASPDAGSDASGSTPVAHCAETDPRPGTPEVFIGPDGLRARMTALFDTAGRSLRVMTYELTDATIVRSLIDARGRGVDVRVLLDGNQEVNAAARASLSGAGVAVQSGPSEFSHYHAKIVLVDERRAVVMSANLNDYSLRTERNHGVLLDDADDVADLVSLFDHDWEGRGGSPASLSCSRLVVSPVNARARIERLLSSATAQLRVQHLSLSDDAMRFALGVIAGRGVRVRVILADPSWIDTNGAAAADLGASGVEVRFLSTPENHAKLIVADNAHAFVGSENLSWTSIERNREIGVVLGDPSAVAALRDAFDADWSRTWAP